MDPLINYSLPISGMKEGLHQFDFQVDGSFFEAFEASAIKKSDLQVHLDFDKHASFFDLRFEIVGTIEQECDRCLDKFNLPLEAVNMLQVKFDEDEREEADVVFISRERKNLNVASYIYEFVHLAIPMSKTHDLADEDCNPEFLEYFNGPESEEQEKSDRPSVWDELKKLKDQ